MTKKLYRRILDKLDPDFECTFFLKKNLHNLADLTKSVNWLEIWKWSEWLENSSIGWWKVRDVKP